MVLPLAHRVEQGLKLILHKLGPRFQLLGNYFLSCLVACARISEMNAFARFIAAGKHAYQ